jgi:prepilin-type N-terminal cleavage/methylation domain-containing protein
MKIKCSLLRASKAFTLIEMAIVITILGLLVASVTAGAALIEQARIRGVISEMQEMQSKVATFESVHNYKPGDFPEASKFWGNNVCGGITDGANGNGDGLIKFAKLNAVPGQSDAVVESYLAWCHLNKANLGPSLTPLQDITAAPTIGTNIPHSKLKSGGYIMMNDAFNFDVYQNALVLGAPVADMTAPGAALTPKQAYAIDRKLDDGMPETGAIRAKVGNGISTSGACISSSEYNIATRGANLDCTIALLIN